MRAFIVMMNTSFDDGDHCDVSSEPVAVTTDEQAAKDIADLLQLKPEVREYLRTGLSDTWYTIVESRFVESRDDFVQGR